MYGAGPLHVRQKRPHKNSHNAAIRACRRRLSTRGHELETESGMPVPGVALGALARHHHDAARPVVHSLAHGLARKRAAAQHHDILAQRPVRKACLLPSQSRCSLQHCVRNHSASACSWEVESARYVSPSSLLSTSQQRTCARRTSRCSACGGPCHGALACKPSSDAKEDAAGTAPCR